MGEKALELGAGGTVAPFDLGSFQKNMEAKLPYTCGFNLFGVSFTWSANPSMPLNTKSARTSEQLVLLSELT